MSPECSELILPYPGWTPREYRLPRPLTGEDITAFLGNEELYVRETGSGPVMIIHKFGLAELHCRLGEPRVLVWFNPNKGSYPSEYVDALLSTRFF